MGKLRIAILAGGWSREREISLEGGRVVFDGLDKKKYDVEMYDPRTELKEIIAHRATLDLAFILLHGRYGEDGRIQGLMDILGIRYVGSGVLASAMALNKKIAKEMYRTAGLSVAKDVILSSGTEFSAEDIMDKLKGPGVVKPLDEGSSLGMSVCRDRRELEKGIKEAFQYGREVMVEAFVEGTEVTCCVIGNDVPETLPLIEILPKEKYRFFNYEAKYSPGATTEICPAKIEKPLAERAAMSAVTAHRVLKCSVWSRTDMIIRNSDIFVLETNTIPGMTRTSLFPLAARAAGMSFSELLDRLITLSLEKQGGAEMRI